MTKAKDQTKSASRTASAEKPKRVSYAKKKGPKPQFAEINCPFGDDISIIHCPVCGKATMKLSENGEGQVTACPHLLFMFIDEVGEFQYLSSDLEKRFEEAEIEPESIEDFTEVLAECGYGSSVLVLAVTTSGMACGPFSMTVTHAFDFAAREKE